jgi:2-polyprenyl-6-methoxyphenol hydroxylase-like FAD-dependent oxidoreductase
MNSSKKVDVVVVGSSIAGLLSAAAAASAGTEVVVIDRRRRPTQGASIAPQGRFPHVLLAGGVVALESLLPGIVTELLDEGAQPARATSGLWWAGGIRPAWESPHVIPLARRAQIEAVIRRRVEALPGVSIRYETRAAGLVRTGDHVHGVELDDGRLLADLVVDAAGRGSHLDQWLERLGWAPLRTEEQRINLSYAAVFVEDAIGCLGSSNWVVVQNRPPRWPRIGLTIRVDPTTWGVVLAGYHGDEPPPDLDGLRAFAQTLPIDHVATVLDHADDDTEILRHRIPTSRRRRLNYRGLPSGLVVVGDSLCSFNPVFGQGMTVAAQQALALNQHLTAPGRRSASTARLQRRIERPANEAWTAATTLDADHPDSTGVRPNPVQRRYMHAVIDAATRNATVARDLDRVASLTAPGSSLLRPAPMARVLTHSRSMPITTTEPSIRRPKKAQVAR